MTVVHVPANFIRQDGHRDEVNTTCQCSCADPLLLFDSDESFIIRQYGREEVAHGMLITSQQF